MDKKAIKDILKNSEHEREQLAERLMFVTAELEEELKIAKSYGTQYLHEIEDRYTKEIERIKKELRLIDAVVDGVYECSRANKVVLMAVFMNGYTYEEAAERLEVDPSTIARRVERAITELTEKVNKNFEMSA